MDIKMLDEIINIKLNSQEHLHLWYAVTNLLGIPDCTDVKELITRAVEVSLSEKHQAVREAITKLLSNVASPRLTPINPRAC